MASDDATDDADDAGDATDGGPDGAGDATDGGPDGADADAGSAREEFDSARARLEAEASDVAEGFDERLVDLLSWLLDTETRARIYVFLREHPESTSEEVAEGTGLYPSTVREALAELHEEGHVTRDKRESVGAGNNPYEYDAIAPSELVEGVVEQVQAELNTVFNLDDLLGRGGDADGDTAEPVTITVESGQGAPADDDAETGGDDAESGSDGDDVDGGEADAGADGRDADGDGDESA
ncbi:helix-turn-helix domain-containing protein [Halobaculum sp. D14]|uniref:helix-turn-helix domain-containing protein n=1 Tax=unclassified Halobaculum TaxID=2640896 RepID=UPI003EB98DE2